MVDENGEAGKSGEGWLADGQDRFVRIERESGAAPLEFNTDVPPLLPNGDDGIRSGDQIRAELAQLLSELDNAS